MLKAPFPYFGGKSSVAQDIWQLLGQPRHYIEPFFGSGAVLLARPEYDPTIHTETICDADGYVCNVWRSIKYSPDETAGWCDWPVNHADLSARRKVIIKNEEHLLENLIKDDMWHDPKLAGYWIWSSCCWIGSGLTRPNAIPNAIPNVSGGGVGVHKLSNMPHLAHGGKGVHQLSNRPQLGGAFSMRNNSIHEWFEHLSNRLRYVRVVCGDWTRVCGGNWQDRMGTVGIFFDPPYSEKAGRSKGVYHRDCLKVAHEVREWALERGKRKRYRIVLAGYFDEHKDLLNHGWGARRWSALGGYANQRKGEKNENRHKEALFYSPYCHGITLFPLKEEGGSLHE